MLPCMFSHRRLNDFQGWYFGTYKVVGRHLGKYFTYSGTRVSSTGTCPPTCPGTQAAWWARRDGFRMDYPLQSVACLTIKLNSQPDMDTACRDDKANMLGYVCTYLSVCYGGHTSTCRLASCHTGTLEPQENEGLQYTVGANLRMQDLLLDYTHTYMPYRQADGYTSCLDVMKQPTVYRQLLLREPIQHWI